MSLIRNVVLALSLVFSQAVLANEPVDINSASAEEIARSLSGIGMHKAEAIVAYRSKHGPFQAVAELEKVKGIGSGTIEKNQGVISVGGN